MLLLGSGHCFRDQRRHPAHLRRFIAGNHPPYGRSRHRRHRTADHGRARTSAQQQPAALPAIRRPRARAPRGAGLAPQLPPPGLDRRLCAGRL
ncbi:hypothetical protein G6F22_021666 [Rhizopus arrhizus]|nr:hypothetical protein G6F22_021666 [Rhizopus arrhizus]